MAAIAVYFVNVLYKLTQKNSMTKKSRRAFRFSNRQAGFSLVEVCVALGVLTVTMIPLMGLMTVELGQVGKNLDNNQAVNISQQVVVEAQQMTFSSLTALGGSNGTGTYQRYFSYQGDAETAGSSQIAYTAKVTVTTYSAGATTTALPGGDATQPTLVTLAIQVRKTPGGIDAPTNPAVANFVSMISCSDLDYSGNSGI